VWCHRFDTGDAIHVRRPAVAAASGMRRRYEYPSGPDLAEALRSIIADNTPPEPADPR
jgi:hypothetical protein